MNNEQEKWEWEIEFFTKFGANKIWVTPSEDNVQTILEIHSFIRQQREQARREGYMEAVDLIPDNMLDGYEAPGLMVQKVKDRLKAKLNNERDTYHFTKEESRQSTSN